MHRTKSSAFDIGRLTRLGVFKLSSIVALAAITLGLGGSGAEAGIMIATPAGLNTGDTFRIAFVTDATTTAFSNLISTYNTFVNTDATTEAGGGTVTYAGIPLTFSAIASARDISEISNVGVTGAPVFLVDGEVVATNDFIGGGGLWTGSLLTPGQSSVGQLVQ